MADGPALAAEPEDRACGRRVALAASVKEMVAITNDAGACLSAGADRGGAGDRLWPTPNRVDAWKV